MIYNKVTRRLIKNNAGSVLVMTVILSMSIIILGAAYLQYSDHYRRDLSFQIAQDMAIIGAHAIAVKGSVEKSSGGVNYQSPTELLYETDDGYKVRCYYKCGTGDYSNNGVSSTNEYSVAGYASVTSREFDGEISDTCDQGMASHSYAAWLYITDKETQSYRTPPDDTLRFWGPDTLDGKVHSNDMLHFQQGNGYWPVFYELVTSCSTRFSPVDAPDYVHFYGGYKIPYGYLPFPLQADSVRKYNGYKQPNLGVIPSEQGIKVTEITLLDAEQGFIVRHRSQVGPLGSRNRYKFPADPDNPGNNVYDYTLNDAPRYPYPPSGALFIEGELWLTAAKGTHFNVGTYMGQTGDGSGPMGTGFEGELTIAASGDIIIADDVVYKSSLANGSVPTDSPDVLGLISEKHILVWRNSASIVRIDAGLGAIGKQTQYDQIEASRCPAPYGSIIPVDGRFGTISIDGINCYGWTNDKTTLTIMGCLIQKERGLIHTTYISGERGFDSKDYTYDTRFRRHPPPHFFQTKGTTSYYREAEPHWLW